MGVLLSSLGALVAIIVLGYRLLDVTETVTRGGDLHGPYSSNVGEGGFSEVSVRKKEEPGICSAPSRAA